MIILSLDFLLGFNNILMIMIALQALVFSLSEVCISYSFREMHFKEEGEKASPACV